MYQVLSRRRFLVSAAAGFASCALADMPSAVAASRPAAGARIIVNYSSYVQDRSTVDASRAEHQEYADMLREQNHLVTGGPLLGEDGRPSGVLLVYSVASNQEAEILVQRDPFMLKGAVQSYQLNEWTELDSNAALLVASLVTPERRTKASAQDVRTYVSYVKFGADRSQLEHSKAAHQSYARAIKENGQLIMAGPFSDGSGALSIYRARSKEEVMGLVQNDPYHTGGVIESYALSEWRMFGLNAGLIG